MIERRRYLVLDGFVPRQPEYGWIEVTHVYDGLRASGIVLSAAMIRLFHPSEPSASTTYHSGTNRPAEVDVRLLPRFCERMPYRASGMRVLPCACGPLCRPTRFGLTWQYGARETGGAAVLTLYTTLP